MQFFSAGTFNEWRDQARQALTHRLPPEQVQWQDETQQSLFTATPLSSDIVQAIHVPRDFADLANIVACHNDPERWQLLYQALWRILHQDKNLLKISSDKLTSRLNLMAKAVRRDAHKTKAFVRFYKRHDGNEEHFIAWHNPDHNVLRLVAPFFQRRFAVMKWTIMTPFETAYWDGQNLHFLPGVPEQQAPSEDSLEQMWQTYYRSTFNPARIKLDMMKREMPLRHWKTLPETNLIPAMLKEAEQRVSTMLAHQEGLATSATLYLPAEKTLPALRQAAEKCKACPLYRCASRTVFGKGPANAKIMIIGEQPGDQEDRQGENFVGPAGQVLNKALDHAGLNRDHLYLTNAVKHFGFVEKNGIRTHLSPSIDEVNACKPWLHAEIALVKPDLIVCLGLTAIRAVTGKLVKLRETRGILHDDQGQKILFPYHPSAILRMPDLHQAEIMRQQLTDDLKMAKDYLLLLPQAPKLTEPS